MLHTTYFSNIDKLPGDTIIIVISLYPPKGFKINNINIFHKIELSSSKENFIKYKNKMITFEEYIRLYILKLIWTQSSIDLLELIYKGLVKGKNIAFVCYEKDYLKCHRYFLAKYIEEKYGIEWKEI